MNEESETEDLLGKEIKNYNHLHIYQKGIIYDDDYLLWDEIEQILVGGMEVTVNFAPAFEDRKIILVDSTGERQIKIFVSSLFYLNQEKINLFSEILSIIRSHVEKRNIQVSYL